MVLAGVLAFDFAEVIKANLVYSQIDTTTPTTVFALSPMTNYTAVQLNQPNTPATFLTVGDFTADPIPTNRDPIAYAGGRFVLYIDQGKTHQHDDVSQVQQYLLQFPARLEAQNVFYDIGKISPQIKEVWVD